MNFAARYVMSEEVVVSEWLVGGAMRPNTTTTSRYYARFHNMPRYINKLHRHTNELNLFLY